MKKSSFHGNYRSDFKTSYNGKDILNIITIITCEFKYSITLFLSFEQKNGQNEQTTIKRIKGYGKRS